MNACEGNAEEEYNGYVVFELNIHGSVANECLDWQPRQFINLVSKDDVAGTGSLLGLGSIAFFMYRRHIRIMYFIWRC